MHRFDNLGILELFTLLHMLDSLIAVIANEGGQRSLQASLLCQNLRMSFSQILPILNRDRRCKSHGSLVVAQAELDLAVLAELTCAQEVISCLVQPVFLLCIRCVCHLHACRILKLDCFCRGHFGELSHMNDLVLRNVLLLLTLAGHELERVCELLLTVGEIKEFVEGQHLVQLVRELIALGPRDELVGTLTAKFERSFRSKSVFWSVDHSKLRIVILLRSQEVYFERLYKAIDRECSN